MNGMREDNGKEKTNQKPFKFKICKIYEGEKNTLKIINFS